MELRSHLRLPKPPSAHRQAAMLGCPWEAEVVGRVCWAVTMLMRTLVLPEDFESQPEVVSSARLPKL